MAVILSFTFPNFEFTDLMECGCLCRNHSEQTRRSDRTCASIIQYRAIFLSMGRGSVNRFGVRTL